ncbi:putative transcriptional regulator SUPERMAN-like [Cocos nucifera]|uniref:Putative transcriptional regulator SUPERMAN-like n=1 Tax=Cocos nucifera TaxID=13894 RepID=A0A8K0MUQ3_COCNU|nr:putative transcriptional regulator SUPERMAN-like [Cocos nucifera]
MARASATKGRHLTGPLLHCGCNGGGPCVQCGLSIAKSSEEHDGRDYFFYRCKFCNRTFPTPQSLGGHHNSHRHLKVMWQETRGRSVRRNQESRPLQAAPPAVPLALTGPSHQEGTVTGPVVWAVTLNVPDEPMRAILRRELHQPVERGCNAARPEDLSEDVMTWVEGLLVDPEEEASEPALAGYEDGGAFADGSSVKMDLNLNLKKT